MKNWAVFVSSVSFQSIRSIDRYRNDRFSFVAFALFVQIALKWKNLSLIRSFLPHLVGISLRFFNYSFIDVDPFVFFWIYEFFFFLWIASWGKANLVSQKGVDFIYNILFVVSILYQIFLTSFHLGSRWFSVEINMSTRIQFKIWKWFFSRPNFKLRS